MYGLVLDHLQGFTVILYDNMSAVNVCVVLLEAKAQ